MPRPAPPTAPTATSERAPAGLPAATAAFAALVVVAVIYRLRLAFGVGDTFASDLPAPLLSLLRQGAADVMFALLIGGLFLLVGQLAAGRSGWLRPLGLGLATLTLLEIGVLSQAQYGTFFATGSGLTAQLLEESLQWAALKELLLLLTPGEVLFMLLPPLLFLGLLLLPRRAQRPLVGALAAVGAALVAVGGLLPAAPLPEALLHHPVGFVALDLMRSHRQARALSLLRRAGAQPNPAADPNLDPNGGGPPPPSDDREVPMAPVTPDEAPPTLALLSPPFVAPTAPAAPPLRKRIPWSESDEGAEPPPAGAAGSPPPYSVLFVIMESTGLDYALKPIPGSDQVAMPFVRSLAAKGFWLSNHYSSGNSSPRGIFSLLSGLYVLPEVGIYDVRKDIYLPSLASYLGPRYGRFLVTPASLDWYFPHAFMTHSGFQELWGYHALPVRRNAPGGRSHARDEAETVGFFLRRLDEQLGTGAPFLAVYYSFIAHWPYPDYGRETHVIANPTRPLHAYYNDLHYLDGQIERIFRHLEERGVLDRTILVLVGDHGEAFGQHPSNYTHSRASFNENLRTPAILYQPRLFPPRVVTAPTSHVDILPTLLDGLGVPYDARLVQGESLFQDRFRRRYIFTYGNEDTLTSIAADGTKLQVSFRDGSCWAYNLTADPDERHRLACQPYREQQQALLLYHRHQQTALRRYNRISEKRGYGQSPPTGASVAGQPGEGHADYVAPARRQLGHSP